MNTNDLDKYLPSNGNNSDTNNNLDAYLPTSQGQQLPSNASNLNTAVNSLSQLQQGNSDHGTRMAAIDLAGNAISQNTINFMDTFNNQMSKLPNGILQILGLGNVSANGGTTINQQIAMHNRDAQVARDNAKQEGTYGALAGDILGFTGNAIDTAALGISAGKALGSGMSTIVPETYSNIGQGISNIEENLPNLSKAATSAGITGLYGASQPIQSDESRESNIRNGIIAGAITPTVLDAISPVANTVGGAIKDAYNRAVPDTVGYLNKVFNPEGAAINNLTNQLKNVGVTGNSLQESLLPSQNIGANLSLGEATGKDAIKTMESRLGTGSLLDANLATKHLEDLQNIIGQKATDTINSIVPEGTPQEVSDILANKYADMKNYNINDDQMQQILNNKTLFPYLDKINNGEGMPEDLVNLPDNNVYKLEQINKDLNNDMNSNVNSATKNANTSLSSTQLLGYSQAKNQLQSILADAMPENEYANTLDLAQRNIYRNNILNDLDKIKSAPNTVNANGQTIPPISQVYKTLWNTPQQRDNFLKMVSQGGGDIGTANNIMTTINQVLNTPIQTILKGTRVASETAAEKADRDNVLKTMWNQLTTNDYKEELLKLSLGGAPEQAKILSKLNQSPLSDRIVGLNTILQGLKSSKYAINQSNIPANAAAGYLDNPQ